MPAFLRGPKPIKETPTPAPTLSQTDTLTPHHRQPRHFIGLALRRVECGGPLYAMEIIKATVRAVPRSAFEV